MKYTKSSAIKQMSDAAAEVKALFAPDATAHDGSLHRDNIDQELANAIRDFENYPKFSNNSPWLEKRVARFTGSLNGFRRIAARKPKQTA